MSALHESIDGLVIRVKDMGDHDRYLTVLTAKKGRITILSKGSRSIKGEQRAVSQLYTYGNFEFYRKGTLYILKGGAPIHPFYALSLDIDRLNLAAYFCDLAYELSDEGEDAQEMLRLLLNSLYAISRELYPRELVKAAFEMRAAAINGYAPDLSHCAYCEKDTDPNLYLDVMNGALVCSDCLQKRGRAAKNIGTYDDIREADILVPLTIPVCDALRFILKTPMERLFSFELREKEDLKTLCTAAETYILSHLGRGFDSLDFYHSMLESAKGMIT